MLRLMELFVFFYDTLNYLLTYSTYYSLCNE